MQSDVVDHLNWADWQLAVSNPLSAPGRYVTDAHIALQQRCLGRGAWNKFSPLAKPIKSDLSGSIRALQYGKRADPTEPDQSCTPARGIVDSSQGSVLLPASLLPGSGEACISLRLHDSFRHAATGNRFFGSGHAQRRKRIWDGTLFFAINRHYRIPGIHTPSAS